MNCESSIRTGSKAFTLIEVIVGFTLTVLLVGLIFQFLLPALKISRRTSLRAELQQQATLAMREMVSELEQTNVYGTSLSPDGSTVAVHPILEVSQNGRRIYADYVVVYRFDYARKELIRGVWGTGADPSTDSPRRLSPEELSSVGPQLRNTRVIVDEVENFQLTHSGEDAYLVLPMLCRLSLREPSDSNRSFELVRSISPRNQQ